MLTTPKADGFYMPAEWYPQYQVWMIWPERTDNWRLGAKPAQKAFTEVALAIAEFARVTVGVSARQYENALLHLTKESTDKPIRVVELSSNDAWARDTGPTFVIRKDGEELRGVDWGFNAWGGLEGGLYFPWDFDEQVASKILQIEGCHRYRCDGFVLEGGSIHVDGEGTVLTTEECLLNHNRNPHLTRQQIEQYLSDYLNIEKVIWLPQGLYNDETNGHIDNFCCFIRPAEVILAWTDDVNNPNYGRCQEAWQVLEATTDAQGRKLTIHKMPIPGPLFATEEECAGVDYQQGSQPRDPSIQLAGSYINFLIVNDGIVAPCFNDPKDQEAQAILQQLFPDKKVVMVAGREILLGGGNIHCITQQQPF
ncbi:agmatine deiminase [Entomomonas asaccharolytica]|uniref:Agmatine deiminase n=1 Tax=Entomomonas asaccharolytica TaxID=2785331 RepID=A0A974RX59_9GAMM|nr:agmatine deiminase [Entomomonas asaccharolytica]QQP85878.1 agmatine deiminase [Entomomonas asaccharolytica]